MLPADVSAVVCTLNSSSGIEKCLLSLRHAGVGETIVVDGGSTDGTREVAEHLADVVLEDPGTGLGNARNVGIAQSTRALVLNMGSDNVLPEGELQQMIDALEASGCQGVSAQTIIEGDDFVSRGLNAWRKGRFRPGPADVIGTPTLFEGDLIRAHPYDSTRVFSDDSELCERWSREFGATFLISDAYVTEIGKTNWPEILARCRMYGISDEEIFRIGRAAGWSPQRQVRSLAHPLSSDLLRPLVNLSFSEAAINAPFLVAFTAMRYGYWARRAVKGSTE